MLNLTGSTLLPPLRPLASPNSMYTIKDKPIWAGHGRVCLIP